VRRKRRSRKVSDIFNFSNFSVDTIPNFLIIEACEKFWEDAVGLSMVTSSDNIFSTMLIPNLKSDLRSGNPLGCSS